MTKPELDDALIAEAWAMRTDAPRGDMVSIARELAAALTAERALRVKAEQRIADAPHEEGCAGPWEPYLHRCNCWKSETPS